MFESKMQWILLIDRLGTLGEKIFDEIESSIPILFVTQKESKRIEKIGEQKVVMPYWKKIPKLPNNSYSHIVLVYNGEKQFRDLLPPMIEKARIEKAPVILIIHYQYLREKFVLDFFDFYDNSWILVIGDLFSETNTSKPKNIIESMLSQAKKQGRIFIPNMGIYEQYPVALQDCIKMICELLKESSIRHRFLYLFPKHPTTLLTIARLVQKIDPLVKIDFKNTTHFQTHPLYILPHASFLFEPSYPLKKRLQKIYENLHANEKEEDTTNELPKTRFNSHPLRMIFMGIASFAFLLIFPVLVMMGGMSLGFLQFSWAKEEFAKGNLAGATVNGARANALFHIAASASGLVTFEAVLLYKQEELEKIRSTIQIGADLSELLTSTSRSFLTIEAIAQGKSFHPKEEFIASTADLKNNLITFQKIQALASAKDSSMSPQIAQKINSTYLPTKYFIPIVDVLPKLLGFEGKKKYLLLFQNNMELRPTGGFIGSYAQVSIDQARLSDFTVHDVYDADGQLKGHVEPPFPIRRYLGSVHWYLRDSNFDLDFPKSASQSAFLFQKETNQSIDGIIAIDSSVIKNLLEALGPVEVPDYHETVNSENMYLLTQTHAEKNFFPGSSQKKDFLTSLFTALQQKLSTQVSYEKLFQALENSITQKHMVFAFSDENIQNLFTINGMSDALQDKRAADTKQVLDIFSINEANLGANKANYFLARNVSHAVSLSKTGAIHETVTLSYTNNSEVGKWPGGVYSAYIRLVVPLGSQLQKIVIDGRIQPVSEAITDPTVYEDKKFKPQGFEVDQTTENGFTVLGFFVQVLEKSQKTIEVSYDTLQGFSVFDPAPSYDLLFLKQAGIDSIAYTLTVSYPDSQKVIKTVPKALLTDPQVTINSDITQDSTFHIDFAKK